MSKYNISERGRRPPRWTGTIVVLAALALILATSACTRKAVVPTAPPPDRPAGGLPPGCGMVVRLRPASLGPIGDVVVESLAAQVGRGAKAAGLNFGRDISMVSYCKFGSRQGQGDFVLLLSGRMPPAVLESWASGTAGLERADIGGTAVIGRDGTWLTHRTVRSEAELVVASDRDLLRLALMEAPATYRTDANGALSGYLGGEEVRRSMRTDPASGRSGFEAVEQLLWTLAPDSRIFTVRMVVRDARLAKELSQALIPVSQALAQQTMGEAYSRAAVTTSVVENDVVTRVSLPPGVFDVLAARMVNQVSRSRR